MLPALLPAPVDKSQQVLPTNARGGEPTGSANKSCQQVLPTNANQVLPTNARGGFLGSCGFDDADFGDFAEEDDEFVDLDAAELGDLASFAEPTPPIALVRPYGKVIKGKTKPEHTAYAHIRPLGSRLAALARKRKVSEITKDNQVAQKRARTQALFWARRNIGAIGERIDQDGLSHEIHYNWEFADSIHPSHDIKAIGTLCDALRCAKCAAWNAGGPLKKLKFPCHGSVPASSAFQHRLLTLGVIPRKGARVQRN
jgi:hypothetical protein